MKNIRAKIPDPLSARIKYVTAVTKLFQAQVIVVLLQIALSADSLEALPDMVLEVYRQTQEKMKSESQTSQ